MKNYCYLCEKEETLSHSYVDCERRLAKKKLEIYTLPQKAIFRNPYEPPTSNIQLRHLEEIINKQSTYIKFLEGKIKKIKDVQNTI